MNSKERKVVDGILNGNRNPNTAYNQKILSRSHVAITLEAILDQAGLTDDALTRRLRQIVKRRPERQVTKGGASISNQTTVDNNALNAIRTIWQARGKFTDKHDVSVSGNLKNLSDDQLDTLISQGSRFLKVNKNVLN